MALTTQPYKGARDFYPEDKRIQKYMFDRLRAAVELYGYEEYDAPILEPLELYLAKSGEEIVNEQTYSFEDRGGRKVVIRPEMTPTVSRMVAARRQELAYPLRWYSIPNLWRYERPQRGRLREHWQLNVDIFGVADSSAEKEMINVVATIFSQLGADASMYQITLSHRGLIDYVLGDYLSLDEATRYSVSKLIDRMHKLERPIFITQLDALLTPDQRASGVTESLLEVLDVTELSDLPAEVQSQVAYTELQNLLRDLHAQGLNNVVFDPTLMRGFDYYTGIVFEVTDTDLENNRAMLGGGRYDGLVGLFGVAPVPTVGFGWGDVTLQNFLVSHHLLPALPSETNLLAVYLSADTAKADAVVSALRSKGVSVAAGATNKKLTDQFKVAEKKGIARLLILGDKELTSGQLTLKDLATGEEQQATLESIPGLLGL